MGGMIMKKRLLGLLLLATLLISTTGAVFAGEIDFLNPKMYSKIEITAVQEDSTF